MKNKNEKLKGGEIGKTLSPQGSPPSSHPPLLCTILSRRHLTTRTVVLYCSSPVCFFIVLVVFVLVLATWVGGGCGTGLGYLLSYFHVRVAVFLRVLQDGREMKQFSVGYWFCDSWFVCFCVRKVVGR